MTFWEFLTWIAILILGPGAIAVFVLFLWDAKRFFHDLKRDVGG